MSVEYNPVGVTCNLSCPYCYEHPQRDAGNFTKIDNKEKVKEVLSDIGTSFSIFGGEPLLTDIDDLEEIWKWGLEKFGQNGIQSNGTLITPKHIELFRKYNVHVGMSMDGPDELNDSRWAKDLESTRENTQKSMDNLDNLLKANMPCSLIITLYQGNVRNGRFKKLKKWLRELDQKGLKYARIHLLEVDHSEVAEKMKLTDQENIDCLIELNELEKGLNQLTFDLFTDVRNLLLGTDNSTTCIWNACDPLTTSAVQGVDANGDRHNCGRTNKDGVNWYKASQPGHERQLSLYHTPWENGGCQGCRFFAFCKGECPGTGEDSDWRKKTDQCWVWYKLFEYVEQELLDEGHSPVSLRSNLHDIENIMLSHWEQGQTININQSLKIIASGMQGTRIPHSNNGHGDTHGDAPHGDHTDNGDNPGEHGDSHGDHTDNPKQEPQEHGDSHGDSPHGDSN